MTTLEISYSIVITYFSPTLRQLFTSLHSIPMPTCNLWIDQPPGNLSKHYTMSERIVNTQYNLHHTTHVRTQSAPSSPEAMAKGKDTPAKTSHLYSDIIKAKDLAPSSTTEVSPGSRKFSSEYPDGQRSLVAIIAGALAAIHDSNTPTMKGLPDTPGSALTSVWWVRRIRLPFQGLRFYGLFTNIIIDALPHKLGVMSFAPLVTMA